MASGPASSPVLGPSRDAWVAGGDPLAGAGAWGRARGDTALGEQGLAAAASTGCSFSKLATSTSVLSEQRFFDGDGFVQGFSRKKEGKIQNPILSHSSNNLPQVLNK